MFTPENGFHVFFAVVLLKSFKIVFPGLLPFCLIQSVEVLCQTAHCVCPNVVMTTFLNVLISKMWKGWFCCVPCL